MTSSPLPDWLSLSEVDDGAFFAGALFQRKFAAAPPEVGHHLVALYRSEDGRMQTAGYVHFMEFGDIVLVGGGCTDGEVIRSMPEAHRARIRELDGLLFHLLRYGFARFAGRCEAYFGHCGDARAEAVDLKAGFIKTGHEHLLVHWHRDGQHEVLRRALVAKALAIGAF